MSRTAYDMLRRPDRAAQGRWVRQGNSIILFDARPPGRRSVESELEISGPPAAGSAAFRKWVQESLNRILGSGLVVDGIFGPKTVAAVKAFQQRQNLVVDGKVGPKTTHALQTALSGVVPGSSVCGLVDKPSEDLVGFIFGDHRLRPAHAAQIQKVAQCIFASQASGSPIRSVRLVGHTDPVGTPQENFKLGLLRAQSAAKSLADTLNKLSPGLGGRVAIFPDSRGETEVIPGSAQRSRRVQIFLPLTPAPAPVCQITIPASEDPTALSISAVGNLDFNAGTKTLMGRKMALQGSVFFPADTTNPKKFNSKLKGAVPIVVIAHGNHATFRNPANRNDEACGSSGGFVPIPNHRGYVYFQTLLARMGIIAVSVDCNQTNCQGLSRTNIALRAELILAALDHFESLNTGGHPVFGGRVDLNRIGLVGHSRGGEAVVVGPEALAKRVPASPYAIKAVLSLAPTDVGTSTGKPAGYPFLALLPAGDGDVITNDGAKFYDQAVPSPFKSQLYVHGANHNFFNTEWPADDSKGPPAMSRSDHERILSVYGAAFFRTALLGHNLLTILNGKEVPPSVKSANVHLSFEQNAATTVDDHEQPNISVNTLGQATSQSSGLTAAEFAFKQATASAFNQTFFGNTNGMVSQSTTTTGLFRSQLARDTDCTGREVWIRSAEVYNGSSVPSKATGFKLGLEDSTGTVAFLDSDLVGSLPRPYDRRADDLASFGTDFTKTILKTLRFPADCFSQVEPKLNLKAIRAIRILQDRGDKRALSFDMLQIV